MSYWSMTSRGIRESTEMLTVFGGRSGTGQASSRMPFPMDTSSLV